MTVGLAPDRTNVSSGGRAGRNPDWETACPPKLFCSEGGAGILQFLLAFVGFLLQQQKLLRFHKLHNRAGVGRN